MSKGVKSIETRHYEERDQFFLGLRASQRAFTEDRRPSAPPRDPGRRTAPAGRRGARGDPATGKPPFTFAYISDTHLTPRVNDRFIRHLEGGRRRQSARPAADFLFGGDLAQLG
jgi:hypothetical protein